MVPVSALLEVDALAAGYGRGTTALRDVSLHIPEQGVVSLLGSNGAGKTTLLRAISGTLPLHSGGIRNGSIRFRGERIDGESTSKLVRRGIRLVPEGRRILVGMSVEENLLIGGLRGLKRGERRARLMEIYEGFPVLSRKRGQRAVLLSGGEQQMLAIGRGLMSRPSLLMLDEPSLGLAPTMINQMADIIQAIAERGTAVLLVEQNASMALRLAHHVVVLRTGSTAFSGTPAELKTDDALHRVYFGGNAAETVVPA